MAYGIDVAAGQTAWTSDTSEFGTGSIELASGDVVSDSPGEQSIELPPSTMMALAEASFVFDQPVDGDKTDTVRIHGPAQEDGDWIRSSDTHSKISFETASGRTLQDFASWTELSTPARH